VNTFDFSRLAPVLLADFCVAFLAGFLSASAKHLLRTAQLSSGMRIKLLDQRVPDQPAAVSLRPMRLSTQPTHSPPGTEAGQT
jgi:hypothetical protein